MTPRAAHRAMCDFCAVALEGDAGTDAAASVASSSLPGRCLIKSAEAERLAGLLHPKWSGDCGLNHSRPDMPAMPNQDHPCRVAPEPESGRAMDGRHAIAG